MSDIAVSFCISSYNRYETLNELILKLLSVNSNRFDVVVCDDCSQDGTVEKIKEIKDQRLKIYVNQSNVGGPANIYHSLDCGDGKYLFYINECDNVNSRKVKKLISIIDQLEEKNVAFAQCYSNMDTLFDYEIFKAGEETLLEFACKIVHPTGYIFSRKIWHSVPKRSIFFEKECYGDYGLTLVSAIISLKYKGAKIYGDICDVKRRRIDFSKEKSRYYQKKKDQRLWYFPDVQWRELMIAYKFLKRINIRESIIENLLQKRYEEALYRIVIGYKDIISDPRNTIHYNMEVPQNSIIVKLKSLKNGLFLWGKMIKFCFLCKKKKLFKMINVDTMQIYKIFIFDV